MFRTKKKQLKRLRNYYENILNSKSAYPQGYIESKENEIMLLEWLIAYYEDRAASTPKQLLEVCIEKSGYYKNSFSIEEYRHYCVYISMLYNWVYNNKIVGF